MYLSTEQHTLASLNPPLIRYKVKSLLEKGSGEFNEDVLLEEGNMLGVFDGATSLDKRRFQDSLTGGYLQQRWLPNLFEIIKVPLTNWPKRRTEVFKKYR